MSTRTPLPHMLASATAQALADGVARKKQTVVLFANTDWYLFNFRLGLCRELRDRGLDPLLLCPEGPYVQQLRDLGFQCETIRISDRLGVLSSLGVFVQVLRTYWRERPDAVHHFTVKCVLAGGVAARLLRIPSIHAVTGQGHLFLDQRLRTRVLRTGARALYKLACGGKHTTVVFQNDEDRDFFLEQRLVTGRSAVIRGSGVDTDRLRPSENGQSGACRILFASRMLREKGIFELIEAAERLQAKGLEFELLFAGSVYPSNPSSLTEAELADLQARGIATVLGHVDDMAALLSSVDLVVLPSYGEGTPKILLEAAACGKPLVATDIAGCRGLVISGVSGELVPVRDAQALTTALERLILDPELRVEYGRQARRVVLEGFTESSVVQRTLDEYALLGVAIPQQS